MNSEFFTNVKVWGNKILYRGRTMNGDPVLHEIPYQPTLFVRTAAGKSSSEWSTIYGQPVEPIKPGTIKECREYIEQYEDVDNFYIYGMTDWAVAFLAEHTGIGQDVVYDFEKIKIAFLDIETECENGFPDVNSANEIINVITMIIPGVCSITWGLGDFQLDDYEDHVALRFDSEYDMLFSFMDHWRHHMPDVLTGWNVNLFDVPYLVHRVKNILGENAAKEFSPWKILQEREVKMFNRVNTAYDIAGVSILDFYDLYQKHTFVRHESYKLDHIAWYELGEKKLDYSEHDSIKTFYQKDFQKFVEYNVKDVDLIIRLENKLKLLALHISLAYYAKVNYDRVFSPVAMWDAIIYNKLLERGQVVEPRSSSMKTAQYAGAYVRDPIPGFHKWVCSFDLTSLYPSIIRGVNISPDTIVEPKDLPNEIRALKSDVSVENILNRELDTSALKEHGLSMAANGQFFRTDHQGFLAELMENMYEERAAAKKRMLNAKKLVEAIEHELKERGDL